MNLLRPLVAAGAFTLTLLGAGQGVVCAADMPRTLPPPGQPAPIVERTQFFDDPGGWYLRGDLGYGWGRIDGAQSAPGFVSPTTGSLDNAMTGGVGVGIKTKWARTDVTVDYTAPLKYKGTIATPDDTTAKIQAVTALFNGYLDLGTWYHLSPYVGAGAGVARVRVFDYASAAAPPFSGDTSLNQWKFAWAAMAGVAVPISRNLQIDAGYRYFVIGDAATASDTFGAMKFKNIASHQVRVGLRWSFDDLQYGQ